MDITRAATPAYFATMGVEHWWLRRRAARNGPSPVDYERRDTIASLTMGTLSLVAPIVTAAGLRRIAPQRHRLGRALAGFAVAAAGGVAVADRVGRRERSDRTDSSHRSQALARRVSQIAGPAAVAGGVVAATAAWVAATNPDRLWERRILPDAGGGAVAALGAIAGWDFVYYWNHRLMHESRLLWAYHVVHHSSQRYNLSTALRQPVADPFGTVLPYGLLCLAGVRPALIEFARGVNLLYQYWIHTDAISTLGPAEEVLNTASHHRVHHASNRRYIDRNHGSIVIIWDRLFGTFEREDDVDEPVVYGLTKNIGTFRPWPIVTHEYADILRDVSAATNWRDRMSFVVRGPGWAYNRHAELAAG